MQKNSLITFLKSILGIKKKPVQFRRFLDPVGDFYISYPKDWRYDRDIAVSEGRYSISFESGEGCFTISVDTAIPKKFDFKKYAKKEFEGPFSGIYAPMKRSEFRGMDAFKREYSFSSEGKDHFGYGIIFYTGKAVFQINYNALEKRREELTKIFNFMLNSLNIGEGFLIKSKK